MTGSMDEGLFIFDFSKAFDTVPQHPHKQTNEVQTRQADSEVDQKWAELMGFVNKGMNCSWKPVTNGVP